MSEHITHVAVCEDSIRLGLHSGRLCPAFRTAAEKHWDLAQFASATRSGDRHSISLLKYLRERWEARKEGDFVEEKLAFLMGWCTHQAADRRFKPVYRQVQPEHYANTTGDEADTVEGPSDVRVLHDTVVFREVYGGGEWGPYPAGLLEPQLESFAASKALDSAFTFSTFGTVFQKMLLDLHPKEHDPKRLPKRYQRFYVDLQRYAQNYYAPGADDLRRFIVEPNFYNPKDPLVALARALQRRQPLPAVNFDEAFERARRGAQYTQSLRMGLRYLFAASEFFENKIPEKEVFERFDLGKSHLEGGTFHE